MGSWTLLHWLIVLGIVAFIFYLFKRDQSKRKSDLSINGESTVTESERDKSLNERQQIVNIIKRDTTGDLGRLSEKELIMMNDVHARHYHAMNLLSEYKPIKFSDPKPGRFVNNYSDADVGIDPRIKRYGLGTHLFPFIAMSLDMAQLYICTGGLIGSHDSDVRKLPVESIIASEIVVNKKSVTETNRQNAIGRAIVGGVLAGGVGALVGAASASSTSKSKDIYKEVNLRISTDNFESPILDVCFLSEGNDPSENDVEKAIAIVNKWHARLSNIIKKNAENTPSMVTQGERGEVGRKTENISQSRIDNILKSEDYKTWFNKHCDGRQFVGLDERASAIVYAHALALDKQFGSTYEDFSLENVTEMLLEFFEPLKEDEDPDDMIDPVKDFLENSKYFVLVVCKPVKDDKKALQAMEKTIKRTMVELGLEL